MEKLNLQGRALLARARLPVKQLPRKKRCCVKSAGDHWSPLHSLYSKVDVFIISALQQSTRFFAVKCSKIFLGFYFLF